MFFSRGVCFYQRKVSASHRDINNNYSLAVLEEEEEMCWGQYSVFIYLQHCIKSRSFMKLFVQTPRFFPTVTSCFK